MGFRDMGCYIGAALLDGQRVYPLHVVAACSMAHDRLQLPVYVLHVARALLECMVLPAVCCGEHCARSQVVLEANYRRVPVASLLDSFHSILLKICDGCDILARGKFGGFNMGIHMLTWFPVRGLQGSFPPTTFQ
jgi:hypothetical protein